MTNGDTSRFSMGDGYPYDNRTPTMTSATSANFIQPTPPRVCPTCHHCPTCGHTTQPIWPQQPTYPQIWSGTTGDGIITAPGGPFTIAGVAPSTTVGINYTDSFR